MKYLFALGVFLLCFIMLYTCLNDFYFDSDEGDVYLCGMLISRGRLVYKDFASQHMPVMYYIAAAFSLLGASSVYQFRLYFYLLFSLMWALNVIWYGDRLNWFGLLFGPICYIVQIRFIFLGTAVLSEHMQSVCMAMLFYELLCFHETHTLTSGNYIRLAMAIFLSIGSAFTSVFPVFFLALTVFALEIAYFIRQDAQGRALWRKEIIPRYLKLVVACIIPFLALALYYVFKNCLADFYYWAYEFNVTVYSKYQGTGGSVLQSLFIGFYYMLTPLRNIALNTASLLQAGLTAATFVAIIMTGFIHRSVILPLGLMLMVNACQTRGDITYFHSMHAVMLQCAIVGYAAGWLAGRIPKKPLRACACLLMAGLILFPFRGNLKNIGHIIVPSEWTPDPGSISQTVDIITDEGDRIGNATLNPSIYMYSGTVPAAITDASIKWAWDGAGEQVMAQLRADPPKVYVFDRNMATWGYALRDYAPELIEFIDSNYTPLSKYMQDIVYVLNSYYDEACRRMDALYGRLALDSTQYVTSVIDQQDLVDGKLFLRGWAILPEGAVGPQRTYVYLVRGRSEIGVFRTQPYDRPDIENIYGSQFRRSGFLAIVDVDDDITNPLEIDATVLIEDDNGIHMDVGGRRTMRRYMSRPQTLLSLAKAG